MSRIVMLADFSFTFFSGAICGALLLCLGLLVGIYLGRRAQASEGGPVNAQQLQHVVAALNRWATGFATDVHQHREVIDSLSQQAREAEQAHEPVTAQSLLDQVRQANETLQSRLAAAEQNLQQQAVQLESYMAEARTDGLTQLPNRRALDVELAARISRWRREGKPLAALMIDVDHFKKLNDAHGHLAGDQVLKRVAEIFKRSDREADFVARYGGEEFCILLPAGIEAVRSIAGRLREAVADEEVGNPERPLRVTISCGGAMTQMGDDAAALLKRADQALYAAKQAGRNRSFWHDGRQCGLLEGPGSEVAAPVAAPTQAAASGFEDVVTDLRKKLKEVAGR